MQSEQVDRFSMTLSIPRALMPIPILSFTEKLIIARIVSLSHRYTDQGCTLSNGELAEMHGCSASAVSNAISKAIWLGFLVSRKDEMKKYKDKDGNTFVSQTRRLSMFIPDAWLYFGEIWADFYFLGDRGAKLIIDWMKKYVAKKNIEKKGEEEDSGLDIEMLHDALVEFLTPQDNGKEEADDPLKKYQRQAPPSEKNQTPPSENSALFMFTYLSSRIRSKSFVRKNENDNDSEPLEDTHTKNQRGDFERLAAFERFWNTFGDKKGKTATLKSWNKIPHLDDALIEKIINGAKRYAKERPNILARGLVPKMAQGWLTDRRWEDELPEGELVKNFGYLEIRGEKRLGRYEDGYYIPHWSEVPDERWDEYLASMNKKH